MKQVVHHEANAQDTFTLTVNTAGTGTGTAGPAGSYKSGQLVTLTNSPAANSVFTSWGGDADCTDGSVTMNTNKTCTATFSLMTGTLALSGPSTCEIATGASSCNINLAWSITNPKAAPTAITAVGMEDINVSNTTSPSFQNNTQGVPVPGGSPTGSRIFYLYNNAVELASTQSTSITATCQTGSAWNGTICALVPVMSGGLTPVGLNCEIALGENTCTATVNWWIKNPENTPTAITATGMGDVDGDGIDGITVTNTLSPDQAGTKVVPVPYPNRRFYLYNNAKSIAPPAEFPPNGSGLLVTAHCGTGHFWNGTECQQNIPIPFSVDLKVNDGDYATDKTFYEVFEGDPLHFSWTSSGNSSLNCWTTNGTSGWSSTATSNLDFAMSASNTIGLYQYTLNCSNDSALGMGKLEKILSFLNPFNSASAASTTASDSVWVKVSHFEIGCLATGTCECVCVGDLCTVNAGGQCLISWECDAPSTASVGFGFSTDIMPLPNGDGIGDTSGSLVVTPVTGSEYSFQCNNGGGGGGPKTIVVKKKPIFIEN